jgi:hypothetical protein
MRFTKVALLPLLFVAPSFADELPDMPKPKVSESVEPILQPKPAIRQAGILMAPWHFDRAVAVLAVAELGIAVRDVQKTQVCLGNRTCTEVDPFAKPFVQNAGLAYSMAIGESYGLGLVGQRMKHSRTWVRHIWWAPQVGGIAAHAIAIHQTWNGKK